MKGSGFPSPRIQSWNTHSFWKGQTWAIRPPKNSLGLRWLH